MSVQNVVLGELIKRRGYGYGYELRDQMREFSEALGYSDTFVYAALLALGLRGGAPLARSRGAARRRAAAESRSVPGDTRPRTVRMGRPTGCQRSRAALVRADGRRERHAVLLGCMIALYLSKDSARTPELRETTTRIVAAGGTLPKLLLPVLRTWRTCNGQRRTT